MALLAAGGSLGREAGLGIGFSGERFSGGEPPVDSQPAHLRHTAWHARQRMTRQKTPAEKDER